MLNLAFNISKSVILPFYFTIENRVRNREAFLQHSYTETGLRDRFQRSDLLESAAFRRSSTREGSTKERKKKDMREKGGSVGERKRMKDTGSATAAVDR